MAETKTKVTQQSVEDFLDKVTEGKKREDSEALIKLMKKITGKPAKMWGSSIIGFDKYHYKYESGHEGEICLAGFSPRKQNFSLYVMAGIPGQAELLKKLGKHKAEKGCVYVKKLEDIDLDVLESLIRRSVEYLKKKYPD
ncbi:MAG TPA: DUF1801 domain-containing protein [Puia sp.]